MIKFLKAKRFNGLLIIHAWGLFSALAVVAFCHSEISRGRIRAIRPRDQTLSYIQSQLYYVEDIKASVQLIIPLWISSHQKFYYMLYHVCRLQEGNETHSLTRSCSPGASPDYSPPSRKQTSLSTQQGQRVVAKHLFQ